jgi:Tfp pilus assembly major pilin PilA
MRFVHVKAASEYTCLPLTYLDYISSYWINHRLFLYYIFEKRCLKKYCQCFVQGRYCYDSCACQNCHNRPGMREDSYVKRRTAINTTTDIPTASFCNQEELLKKQSRPWLDDDSAYSSSHSTNINALDVLVEGQPLSSSNTTTNTNTYINTSININGHTTQTKAATSNRSMSSVPPPRIPEIFKSSTTTSSSSMSLLNSTMTSNAKISQLLPPEIPEVFLNTTSSGAVPPDVFTNPNFWLKTENICGTSLPWTTSLNSVQVQSAMYKESSSVKPWTTK